MRIRIAQGSHNGVPCFTPRVTSDKHAAFLQLPSAVKEVPECCVFTVFEGIGGRLAPKSGALGGEVAVGVVADWELAFCEDAIFYEVAAAEGEYALVQKLNEIGG
jgi:hypothetical protein